MITDTLFHVYLVWLLLPMARIFIAHFRLAIYPFHFAIGTFFHYCSRFARPQHETIAKHNPKSKRVKKKKKNIEKISKVFCKLLN